MLIRFGQSTNRDPSSNGPCGVMNGMESWGRSNSAPLDNAIVQGVVRNARLREFVLLLLCQEFLECFLLDDNRADCSELLSALLLLF